MKLLTIIGARPQFVKAAAVSRAVVEYNRKADAHVIDEIIVHTGQHYDANMSQIFFDELYIPRPHYNLEVGSGRHGAMTGAMLEKIEEVLLHERPDFVLVYGDTNSTLAGALAAVKLGIYSVHIEAGLRSYNRYMPEEINRIVADQTANMLMCPSSASVANLQKEGIGNSDNLNKPFNFNTQRVYLVGDVMYDSILFNGRLAEDKSSILEHLYLQEKSYALATLHRAENTDNQHRLQQIFQDISAIAEEYMPVVMPLHPRTRKCLIEAGFDISSPGLIIIEPVGYLDMMCLERNAGVILTDSGGVQKEAYFMGVPCITLRNETEWTETVQLGWNTLAGAEAGKIMEAFRKANVTIKGQPPFDYTPGARETHESAAYGDGQSAVKIVEILASVERD